MVTPGPRSGGQGRACDAEQIFRFCRLQTTILILILGFQKWSPPGLVWARKRRACDAEQIFRFCRLQTTILILILGFQKWSPPGLVWARKGALATLSKFSDFAVFRRPS